MKNNLTANESKELIEIFKPFLKVKQQEMINAFYEKVNIYINYLYIYKRLFSNYLIKLDEKDVVENLVSKNYILK